MVGTLLALTPRANAAFPGHNGRITFLSGLDDEEIFDMGPDGSQQRNLTNNPAEDFSPAYSPDGRRIAFGSFRAWDPAAGGIPLNSGELYVMNADGPTRNTSPSTCCLTGSRRGLRTGGSWSSLAPSDRRSRTRACPHRPVDHQPPERSGASTDQQPGRGRYAAAVVAGRAAHRLRVGRKRARQLRRLHHPPRRPRPAPTHEHTDSMGSRTIRRMGNGSHSVATAPAAATSL